MERVISNNQSLKEIFFFGVEDDYFEFSNFYPSPIKIDGLYWKTTEHYYQAQKFRNYESKEEIRNCKSPEIAYELGNNLVADRVYNWDKIKLSIMERALYEKFNQHDYLRELLMETENVTLIEDSKVDYFWGIGEEKTGQNNLGKILMRLRERFLVIEKAKAVVNTTWMCVEKDVELPTEYGVGKMNVYMDHLGKEHVAYIIGDINLKDFAVVRIHSECLTGDVFKSKKCDCGSQLDVALKVIQTAALEGKTGILLYMRDEGRGIGLGNKLKAYKFQQQGFNTIEANQVLNVPIDARSYNLPAEILKDLGISKVELITNNPLKIIGLEKMGLVVKRKEEKSTLCEHNKGYLSIKASLMGHSLNFD